MTERSVITDSQILRATTFTEPDERGRVGLKYVLPSGRVVTSTDRLVKGEVKGKVLIAWANAIREQDGFDIAEREEASAAAHAERKARESSLAARQESAAPAQQSGSPTPSYGSPDPSAGTSRDSSPAPSEQDPVQFARDNLATLIVMHDRLATQRSAIETELIRVRSSIKGWTLIVEGLEPGTNAMATREESSDEVQGQEVEEARPLDQRDHVGVPAGSSEGEGEPH